MSGRPQRRFWRRRVTPSQVGNLPFRAEVRCTAAHWEGSVTRVGVSLRRSLATHHSSVRWGHPVRVGAEETMPDGVISKNGALIGIPECVWVLRTFGHCDVNRIGSRVEWVGFTRERGKVAGQ